METMKKMEGIRDIVRESVNVVGIDENGEMDMDGLEYRLHRVNLAMEAIGTAMNGYSETEFEGSDFAAILEVLSEFILNTRLAMCAEEE